MTYNPNAPLVIGQEWPVVVESSFPVGSNAQAVAARFTSSAIDRVTSLSFFTPVIPESGKFVVEVYETGDELTDPATFATNIYQPNEDVANDAPFGGFGDKWKDETGDSSVGTLYQSIDEAGLITSDYLIAQVAAFAGQYSFRVASAAFGARRPSEMRLKVVVAAFGTGLIQCGIKDNFGDVWYWPAQSFAGDQQTLTFKLPALNPFTSALWTQADVQAFDSLYSFVIIDQSTSVACALYQAAFEVDSVAENRVAVGVGSVARRIIWGFAVSSNWQTVFMRTPAGLTYWDRPTPGTDYTIVIRRVTDPITGTTGSFSMGYLDTGESSSTAALPASVDCPQSGHFAATFQVDAQGFIVEGSELNYPSRALSIIFFETGFLSPPFTRAIADSQPYALLLAGVVDTAQPAAQIFSGQASATYGRVRLLVKRAALAVEDLVVQIRRSSDDVAFGSEARLTADQFSTLEAAGAGWRWWDVALGTPASLVSGTAYYVALTSDETHGTDRGWSIAYLSAALNGQLGVELTFESTASHATIDGTSSTDFDLVFFVAELPSPVADFAENIAQLVIPSDGYYSPSIDFVKLTWTPTTLAGLFGWYQIERSDDAGVSWHKIAKITTESVVEYHDIEPLIGIQARYRIAVARSDGTLSLWSSSVTATATATHDFEWFLTSNEHPSLSLAFAGESSGTYEPANPQQVEQPVFGRDRVLLFTPLEEDGDRFTLRLRVGVGTPDRVRRPAFAPLDLLVQAGLSYVCIRDAHGSRWLCGVIIKSYDWHETPGHVHELWATIEVVETSTTFSVPDVLA